MKCRHCGAEIVRTTYSEDGVMKIVWLDTGSWLPEVCPGGYYFHALALEDVIQMLQGLEKELS